MVAWHDRVKETYYNDLLFSSLARHLVATERNLSCKSKARIHPVHTRTSLNAFTYSALLVFTTEVKITV